MKKEKNEIEININLLRKGANTNRTYHMHPKRPIMIFICGNRVFSNKTC